MGSGSFKKHLWVWESGLKVQSTHALPEVQGQFPQLSAAPGLENPLTPQALYTCGAQTSMKATHAYTFLKRRKKKIEKKGGKHSSYPHCKKKKFNLYKNIKFCP